MARISLKRILSRKDLLQTLAHFLEIYQIHLRIEDPAGEIWLETGPVEHCRYPILLDEQVIGWVIGDAKVEAIAQLIALFARQEAEKRSLSSELLNKYQEIDLFQEISTEITNSLNLPEVAQMVVQTIQELIPATSSAILLLDQDTSSFSLLAGYGQPETLGTIVTTPLVRHRMMQLGGPEILNHLADLLPEQAETVQSLMYAPLHSKEQVIGAIVVGSDQPDVYRTGDLKRLTIVASQTAVAIANALLYQQSLMAVTQAQSQAEQLQQTLQELQRTQTRLIQNEKMSSLGQLVAGVAHEINNPVNFIYGNLKFASDYVDDLLHLLQQYRDILPLTSLDLQADLHDADLEFLIDDLPKLLSSMKVGADRILGIVRSLKNFSRHDESEMKSVDIHEGIESTLLILQHRLKPHAHHPAIQVIKQYSPLPLVECYPSQLNQVVMNILVNAIDALEAMQAASEVTEETVPAPTITIRTEVLNDEWVAIRFCDNGPGMSEETVKHIYDPFFTTKEVGKGTGLGMAISHQIVVEKHGGLLKCQSQLGIGTEFSIQIPIQCTKVSASDSSNSPYASLAGLATATQPASEMPSAEVDRPTVMHPVDLASRHAQLIQRLARQNLNITTVSPDRLYQILQANPFLLKLYFALLT